MINQWEHGRGGHFISNRRSPGCVLPKLFARFGMLAYLSVPAISCCENFGGTGPGFEGSVVNNSVNASQTDSSNFTMTLKDGCAISEESPDSRILSMDIFIYGGESADALERHWKEEGCPKELHFRSSKENKLVAAIANSPYGFRDEALKSFESMENVEFLLEDDDAVNPIMTGVCLLEPARSGTLVLKPLMSRIILESVSNNMQGYTRLENPRVYLTDASAVCEAFREDGFYCSETIERTGKIPLPCDVGIFSQKPGTELFCYPSESDVPGPTTLVLECEIKDSTCRFTVPVSPLGRNKNRHVEFVIDTTDRYKSKIYQ